MKLVRVSGDVVVKDGSGLGKEYYERVFELDDAVDSEGVARSVIRRAMIEGELRRSVPGFVRVRTMQVDSMETVSGEKADGGRLERLAMAAVEAGVMPERMDLYRTDAAKERALEGALEGAKLRKARKAGRPRKGVDVVDEGYVD